MEARDQDPKDHQLDRLLEQYAQVEPRPGLEDRILARLRTAASGRQWFRGWAWILAATAAVLSLMMGSGIRRRPAGWPEIRRVARAPQPNSGTPALSAIPAHVPPEPHRPTAGARQRAATGRVREPRLDQFPSARPLTRQELALAHYAQSFPGEAMIMAKQQAKFEEEIEQAEQQFEKNSPTVDQER